MTVFQLPLDTSEKIISEGDFIALEECDEGTLLVVYFNDKDDKIALINRMRAKGQKGDAKLIESKSDECSRFSKKECDKAGGCCKWITSGSFNFCKCI
jgi:hypothetical protein